MPIRVFNPKQTEVGPIGPLMASKISNEGLKAFFESKNEDGNLSSIVVGDSENMGIGVGTWAPGQKTNEPIPIVYDEALFIVDGSFNLSCNGESHHAAQGECVYISAGSLVSFGTDEGCRLVWVTSPPTWRAFEEAWENGTMQPVQEQIAD